MNVARAAMQISTTFHLAMELKVWISVFICQKPSHPRDLWEEHKWREPAFSQYDD